MSVDQIIETDRMINLISIDLDETFHRNKTGLIVDDDPVFQNEEISFYLWGKDSVKSRNGIKTLIHGLRKKFEAIHYIEDLIMTADRIGYRLRTE